MFQQKETERILRVGQAHGLRPKLHAYELVGSGDAELAAASADHLGNISEAASPR